MQSVTGGNVREDGNVYYVIGTKDGNSDFLVRCRTIAQRNQLKGKGLCFVEEAYKGDSTVNRGWAMYMTVGSSTTTTSPRWVKIAEEESVEGAWTLQQEFIRSLVKISTFTKHQQDNEVAFKKIWDKITEIGAFDNHSHSNKPVIDNLTDSNGQLMYKGKSINGSVYVYNEGPDSDRTGLKWINPVDETITSGGHTNDSIADLFARTRVAYAGQTLRVVNLDGSVSTYLMVQVPGGLNPVFIGTTSANTNEKIVRFVTALPDPSAIHVNELFYMLPPAYNGYVIGHFYRCSKTGETEYSWIDVSEQLNSVNEDGARIISCYKTKWNEVKLIFENPQTEPLQILTDNESAIDDHFGKTFIVRKFGSAPTNKNDGIVIKVSTAINETAVSDITPLTKEDVYYGVFSETVNGRSYRDSATCSAKAEFPTWETVEEAINSGKADQFFELGDTITIPVNGFTASKLPCKVAKLSSDSVTLIAQESIGNLTLDGIEYGKVPASGVYESGKMYYQLSTHEYTDNQNNTFTISVFTRITNVTIGADIPENAGIFEGQEVNSAAVSKSDGYVLCGSPDWESSNLNQYLHGSGDNWFVKASDMDVLADEYVGKKGFLIDNAEGALARILESMTIGIPTLAFLRDLSALACVRKDVWFLARQVGYVLKKIPSDTAIHETQLFANTDPIVGDVYPLITLNRTNA